MFSSDNRRPPCPDPDLYVWVNSKEGGYWRKKRGTDKKAKLNTAFMEGTNFMKVSQPAAKRIVDKLKPYLIGLKVGRLTTKISGKLRLALKEKERLHFSFLKDYNVQPEFYKRPVLTAPYQAKVKKDELVVNIPLYPRAVRRNNSLISGYYFELIMIWGDAGKENALKIDSHMSDLLDIDARYKGDCVLSLPIQKKPWMAWLKTTCLEGNELAAAGRNYDMRVVAVG